MRCGLRGRRLAALVSAVASAPKRIKRTKKSDIKPLMKRVMKLLIPPAKDTSHASVADRLLLPDGPKQGRPYRWKDDPVHACLIGELDKSCWDSFACPGAVQTGKSLVLILVPSLRQVIFQRKSVVYAQPSQQKLHEAWTGKVSPAITGAGLGVVAN